MAADLNNIRLGPSMPNDIVIVDPNTILLVCDDLPAGYDEDPLLIGSDVKKPLKGSGGYENSTLG